MKTGLRPKRSKGTWYVSRLSFPETRLSGRRSQVRATESFRNEQEAKAFARARLAEGLNVNARTLNPHLPKRTIHELQFRAAVADHPRYGRR
jgi:hypothetical protein